MDKRKIFVSTSSKYIKECALSTEVGVNIAHKNEYKEENIVFTDFDKNDSFISDKIFKITLVDRHDLKYEHIFEANEKGNTDVVITDDDYVKQGGDLYKKIERALNK